MPDLWNHAVVTTGKAIQVGPSALTTVVEYQISGQVTANNNQTVLASYSFLFPEILATLTADQRDQLMQMVARFLITVKTGL